MFLVSDIHVKNAITETIVTKCWNRKTM